MTVSSQRPQSSSNDAETGRVLAGGGQIGAYLRAMDWSRTPLGPPAAWPQSLRTAVGILLNSRYPMFIFWGPRLVKIYNDSYRPITGSKHPWALGRPGPEVWPEIWDTIGPMAEKVIRNGEATWSDDLLLFMERNGYPEEVYFTFSYSPIREESGGVGGMFCACTETTKRVLGERRLHTLRDLAAEPANARTVEEACRLSAEVLAANPKDIPFALLYLLQGESGPARLAGTAGVGAAAAAVPAVMDADTAGSPWPLLRVARARRPEMVQGLLGRFAEIPPGPWTDPPDSAMILPLVNRALDRTMGLVVLGISSRRAWDEDYRDFFSLLSGQLASSIANVRAAEEERNRAQALEELNRAKTEFFSNVSHEFRTPLTLMLGPLEDSLADTEHPLDTTQRERLELMRRNGLRLLKLVNTLLDFSRIEAGRMEASFAETDISALTAELAGVFRSAVENMGLHYEVHCPPLPEAVYVDSEMWEKIVLNLISNAFKFTLEGAIAVALRPAGASRVELEVRDTGMGIPREQQPYIFDRFHRVRETRSRTHEGSGIGLSLVRDLVKLHGGTVSVESEQGRGSVFTVSLPTGRAHLPPDRIGAPKNLASTAMGSLPHVEEALRWIGAEVPEPPSLEAPAGDSPATPGGRPAQAAPQGRIVLADDNADMRAYLARLLGRHWDVEPVNDGLAALEAARRLRPDLVLSDVMMPGLDGFSLLRELRLDPRTQDLPVILVSARAGEEATVEGLEAGADDYLVKPFSARELIARVAARIEISRLQRQRDQAEKELLRSRRMEAVGKLAGGIAHDFNNLLTAINGYAEMLLGSMPESDPRHELLREISRSGERAAALTAQLLAYSRKQVMLAKPLQLNEVVADCMRLLRRTLGEDIDLVMHLWPGLGPVTADPVQLNRVLVNLAMNARDAMPGGGRLVVETRSVMLDEEGVRRHGDRLRPGKYALLAVHDTGVGMSAEVRERVFEPFFTTKEVGKGTGLGLSSVYGIIRQSGGDIEVESEPGRGSTFRIYLPEGETMIRDRGPGPARQPERPETRE